MFKLIVLITFCLFFTYKCQGCRCCASDDPCPTCLQTCFPGESGCVKQDRYTCAISACTDYSKGCCKLYDTCQGGLLSMTTLTRSVTTSPPVQSVKYCEYDTSLSKCKVTSKPLKYVIPEEIYNKCDKKLVNGRKKCDCLSLSKFILNEYGLSELTRLSDNLYSLSKIQCEFNTTSVIVTDSSAWYRNNLNKSVKVTFGSFKYDLSYSNAPKFVTDEWTKLD